MMAESLLYTIINHRIDKLYGKGEVTLAIDKKSGKPYYTEVSAIPTLSLQCTVSVSVLAKRHVY